MSILSRTIKEIFGSSRRGVSATDACLSRTEDVRQKEGGTIICFFAGSEGNALAEGTKAVMAPFSSMASQTIFIDLNRTGWRDELMDVLFNPVWFAASAFGIGQDIAAVRNGKLVNLWESGGVPFVRFFGDVPAYFPDKHVARFNNSINAYWDISHAMFYRRWFRDPSLSIVCSPVLIDQMPLEQVDVTSKLKGKLIFPKNGNSPLKLIDYWCMALPPTLSKALQVLGEESIGLDWINREPCLDDRIVRYFFEQGVDIAAEPAVLCFLVAQLDDYLRRVKSTMIGEALLDLPITIRGRFWDHVNFRGMRATYDPNSDVASTLPLIDQAPAVIDMSPNTQHSPHNRIWQAVGRGTAFLTNRLEYFDATLPIADRCTFAFEREAIHNLVEHYVTHPKEAIDLGLEQARILRPVFDEAPYVNTVLTAVQMVAMRLGGRPPETQNFVDFPPKLYS
jgi:hypothetical protein